MLLLDTHIAAWLVRAPAVLRQAEVRAIRSNALAVSVISLWELRIKWQLFTSTGERKGPADPLEVLEGLRIFGVEILPLNVEQAVSDLDSPPLHKDPFDELLLAVCQQLGARLLTRDAKLRDHPLAFVP
ncbi:MAG TPA: type II toxin-antitoxin system VapC family toxin [Sphingomonas sp.]|jgi:PIN domain nuclease of toxin-antitoxin system|uniref:type II toxin-antitoxin system VapC family toxin n=1 Tax=Sphingomonas sp. TaxID=28214 RepID=UPI002ED87CF6